MSLSCHEIILFVKCNKCGIEVSLANFDYDEAIKKYGLRACLVCGKKTGNAIAPEKIQKEKTELTPEQKAYWEDELGSYWDMVDDHHEFNDYE